MEKSSSPKAAYGVVDSASSSRSLGLAPETLSSEPMAGSTLVRKSPWLQLGLIAFFTLTIAAIGSHIVAAGVGISRPGATYRRIGPMDGPQAFVAGSSVLQFSLSWRDVSNVLGQGMEGWGVGGSTPEIWEVSQHLSKNSNLMIIGASVYDLNEYRLADTRANIVPFIQTVKDLRESGASWELSQRIVSQYPQALVRFLFPTTGESDAVLVGMRKIARQQLGLASIAEDQARALVLPSQPVLDFGEANTKLSDWPQDRVLRRLSLMRSDNHGKHGFKGPKQLAFRRMLIRAGETGRAIIVILPVAVDYEREFLTPTLKREFEDALNEAQRSAPGALLMRLDQVPALQSDELFTDFVHLNSRGRAIATQLFVDYLKKYDQESLLKK